MWAISLLLTHGRCKFTMNSRTKIGARLFRWFHGHFSRKLKPSWTFETHSENEMIWKLLISRSGILVGEERDVEAKRGSVFAIDVRTGRVLWRGLELEQPWWFGVEKATENTLIVHSFRKPDLPEASGITAIDLLSGAIMWQDRELAYLFESGGRAFAMRQGFTRREFFALDLRTGTVVEEFGEDDTRVNQARSVAYANDPNTSFANSFSSGKDFDEARQLINSIVETNSLLGPIELLDYGIYRVLAFHARPNESEPVLTSELAIFDKARKKLLFHETLHRKTLFPVGASMVAFPDNFFLSHGILLYVKEKRILTGVALA